MKIFNFKLSLLFVISAIFISIQSSEQAQGGSKVVDDTQLVVAVPEAVIAHNIPDVFALLNSIGAERLNPSKIRKMLASRLSDSGFEHITNQDIATIFDAGVNHQSNSQNSKFLLISLHQMFRLQQQIGRIRGMADQYNERLGAHDTRLNAVDATMQEFQKALGKLEGQLKVCLLSMSGLIRESKSFNERLGMQKGILESQTDRLNVQDAILKATSSMAITSSADLVEHDRRLAALENRFSFSSESMKKLICYGIPTIIILQEIVKKFPGLNVIYKNFKGTLSAICICYMLMNNTNINSKISNYTGYIKGGIRFFNSVIDYLDPVI